MKKRTITIYPDGTIELKEIGGNTICFHPGEEIYDGIVQKISDIVWTSDVINNYKKNKRETERRLRIR